jgi:MFS family permease
VLTLPIVPFFADKYGRKWITIIGLGIQIIATLGLLLSYDLTATYVFMFMMGFAMSFRLTVGFVWMQELVPTDYKVWTCTLFSMMQSVTAIASTLYFMYVSDDYMPYFSTALWTCLLSTMMMFSMPESPIYLLQQNRKHEALKIIEQINEHN